MGLAQEDAAATRPDSLVIGNIETTIVYSATDSIVTDLVRNTIFLYGNAKVNYGEITLTAAEIEINQNTNMLIARGLPDSTGRLRNKPVFVQDGQTYEADSMRYNYKTQRGVVIGVVTEQGEGFIQSDRAKRLDDGTMYASGNRYTTCNLAHPHWYINTNKIKLIPDKQIVSGPFNLVLADVPTPLGFAFGIFPFIDKRKSGIIFPTYGESEDRGFFLRNGGYYWHISEYMALSLVGQIYTNGSWGLEAQFPYRKRYRFNGTASVLFSRIFQGEPEERSVQQLFQVRWNHSPTPRGRSSFSASVNFGSSQFNRRNSFNPNDQLANTLTSNVSFATGFDIGNTPVNLSLSARHDQNTNTEIFNVVLPAFNLTVNRIYPFKKPNQSARNFLQKINLNYSANGSVKFTNQAPNPQSFPFQVANVDRDEETGEIILPEQLDFNLQNADAFLQNARIGIIHRIPISTSAKIFRFFSLNPSLSYDEAWYPKRLTYTYLPEQKAVQVDTTQGFYRVYSYSASANLTTRVYGTFIFNRKNKDRYLQAIRHTMIPTVGLSFKPDLSGSPNFFQEIQVDSTGRMAKVSRFANFDPGPPAVTGESGIVNFSLQNVFEAKVRGRSDSAESRKIPLLENLSIGGSYNLVSDSLRLSNISIQARTRFLNIINFNFTGSIDPYSYRILEANAQGEATRQVRVNRFALTEGIGIGQLQNFNIALSANLTPKTFQNSAQKKADAVRQNPQETLGRGISEGEEAQLQAIANNPNEYVDFDIPWTLNLSFNMSYNKTGFFKSVFSQVLSVSGDLSLTETWKVGFRTGYDFGQKTVAFTSIDILKDLHCWEMVFNWTPFGTFRSYNFEIRVKSSILQDLKISRRRSFFDRDFIGF
ncbi:MAG: putative LPS assembly protein LptD [Microscillaceae bacterium]